MVSIAVSRIKLLLFLLLVIWGASANADDDTIYYDKDDPIFRQGKFKGQRVNTDLWQHALPTTESHMERFRQLIPSAEMKNYHFFQNVKHNTKLGGAEAANKGEYYVAAVPKKVAKVFLYLQNMSLKGKVSHGFMGFSFDTPVIMIPKNGKGAVSYTRDMIVSTDGARPEGEGFRARNGFGPHLILHTNFMSMQETHYAYEMYDKDKADKVTQFELPMLTAKQRNKLLKIAIKVSMTNGYSKIYKLLSLQNCCGQVFAMLDMALGKKSFWRKCRINLNYISNFLPGLYREGMGIRGLYNKKYESRLMDDPNYQATIQGRR